MNVHDETPAVHVSTGASPVRVGTGTPIVRETAPEYDGPYSVTPAEQQATLETSGKKMTGDVSVLAIPSDYVGSGVPTLGETSYTPTKTAAIIIPSGKLLTGDQTLEAIPERFYDMSDPMSWLGKDVECLNANVYTKSDTLNNTSFASWTPSTTAATMVSSVSAGTFAADLENYQYYLVWECKCDADYTGQSPTLKAHFLFSRAYIVQEITKRPSTFANVQSNTFDGNNCTSLYASNFLRYYGTTQGSITYSWSASYGIYFGAAAATFSNSTSDTPTVTIKTPTLSARCSTSYFSTGNAAKVNQAKSTWSITGKLYRIKKKGAIRCIMEHVAGMID